MKILNALSRYVRIHPMMSAFLIIFGVVLYLNLSQPRPFIFYFDSGYYWNLSGSFVNQGNFSLVNYQDSLRGYLFPLIIFTIKSLASLMGGTDYIVYEGIMSLVYALLLAVCVPDLIQILFHKKVGFLQSVAFGILSIYFWQGSLFYPLTDFPALMFLFLGIYVILKLQKYGWSAMFAGIFWGGAAIIRPAYQITLLPLLLWVVFYYRKEVNFNTRTILLRSTAILSGLIIIFIPQFLINTVHFEKYSPFVQTKLNEQSLFAQQLGWGIVVQKYETNIGPYYPSESIFFIDSQGESILLKSGYKEAPYSVSKNIFSDKPISLGEYFSLVCMYPLDFLSIFARHLFNGLDIIQNTVYINDAYDSAITMRFINYSLWFLVLTYIARIFTQLNKCNLLTSRFFVPLIFAFPSLLSIPTAMEVRFMLPIHLMAYVLVAYWALSDFIETKSVENKNGVIKLAVGYISFITLCFLFSANTYMGLQFGPYFFSRVVERPELIAESEILFKPDAITIPGNENLFVDSYLLPIDMSRYYSVQFDVVAQESNPELFYVDFYGGPAYDFVGQDKYFMIKRGNHPYSTVIYTGDKLLPPEVFLRIVSLSSSPLTIRNLKVELLRELEE